MKIKVQFLTYIYLILLMTTGYIYEVSYFYFCLLIHELGHITFIKLFNKKIEQLEISPIGGILFIDKCQNDKNYVEFLIYLGGPLFSLILFLFLNQTTENEMLLNASFYILFLNCLPILPLDGSKLISSCIQSVFWYKLTMKIINIFSLIVLFMLLYISIDNLLYCILISFFIYQNILIFFNIDYDYHSFIVYKYLYPNKQLKNRILKKNYYNRLYKGYNNLYNDKQTIYTEQEMLKKLLSGK